MTRPRALSAASSALALALVLAACGAPEGTSTETSAPAATLDRAGFDQPGAHRQYGRPVKVGNGTVRTYVVVDQRNDGVPLELGVALSEDAMEGLPAPSPNPGGGGDGHEHVDMHVYDLAMPARNPTPYRFVELDWNPAGHEPPGIYDVPHFDFHFYTVTPDVRNAIDPATLGEAQFIAKSGHLPPEAERSPFYVALAAPGQPIMAVPRMGTHWIDVRSPELQGVFGHPENFQPFSTTFIHGSWDGDFIFDEPMITRAFIMGRKAATAPAQVDSVMPLAAAQQYRTDGYYPSAYRVTYDAQSKEYRIALTQLAWRD
jgi:hypothetical protein